MPAKVASLTVNAHATPLAPDHVVGSVAGTSAIGMSSLLPAQYWYAAHAMKQTA
jgi:hypothetical protein